MEIIVMSDANQTPFWKRRRALTPGEAILLGVLIAWAGAIVSALLQPRDFSYNFLLILLLSLGPFTGISGYTFWVVCDPKRERRLRRITSIVTSIGIFVPLVAFLAFWRNLEHSMGPSIVIVFIGFLVLIAMYVVGTGLGAVHLVRHLAFTLRRNTKPGAYSRMDNLWDSELDDRG
jgi:uncharacterized membrane protein